MTITQSLAHGLEILLLFDAFTPFWTVPQISRRLGYTQSKTYRLVRTLIKYHFIREKAGTAQYGLGLNAFRIGQVSQIGLHLSEIAGPFMKELSQKTRETVILTGVNGTKAIVLERIESLEPVRFSVFQPGASLSLHAGASSKILMAFLPEMEWDRIIDEEGLQRFTAHTMTDPNKLKQHLREIRRKGYAVSDEEVDRDVRAVAAPIFNARKEIVAGLSVAGPGYRMNKKIVTKTVKLVLEYAQKLSALYVQQE